MIGGWMVEGGLVDVDWIYGDNKYVDGGKRETRQKFLVRCEGSSAIDVSSRLWEAVVLGDGLLLYLACDIDGL